MLKRVIFISNFAANYGGNFLASITQLANFLENKNINVEYIFPLNARAKCWETELNKEKVHYINFDKKSISCFLKAHLIDGDLIHTHFLGAVQLKAIKNILNFFPSTKVVVHEHMDLDPLHGKIYDFLKKKYYKSNFKDFTFIGVSPSVYKRLCLLYGKTKVFLIENAIYFKRLNENIEKNPFGNTKKHIMIFGTDYERKGVDLAISAICNDPLLRKNVELDIIASDPQKTINKIVKDNPGYDKEIIKVLPTTTNIQKYYKNISIFLSPSRHEAFGYANLEAAYCGAQVIASDVSGQNVLKKVPYIRWIENENVLELTKEIKKTLNKTEKDKLTEAKVNKEYILRNYSLERWIEQVFTVYLKVMS